MRSATLLSGFFALSLTSGQLQAAERTPDVRTVVPAQARVWCGPSTSDGMYPTNDLKHGDRVEVMQELQSGWLAIRPPAGSFSWINDRFIKQKFPNYPATYVVTFNDHPAPVYIGSVVNPNRPTKIGVKLQRGAQVRVVAHFMSDQDGTWFPIEAPEGELRYIRKEDVSASSTAVASASVRKTAAEPPPPDGDALWRDADRAERKGKFADAIRLYRQAAHANLSVNPARAEAALSHAHWLEQAGNNAASGSQFAPDRGTAAYPVPGNAAGTNAVRLIGPANSGPANGQLVAMRSTAPNGGMRQPTDYRRGRLQLAYGHQYHRRYNLMDATGNPYFSVVAGPGVDLTNYVGRYVEVWGDSNYISSLRRYVMIVTHIREVP